jgi:hypothetical protein
MVLFDENGTAIESVMTQRHGEFDEPAEWNEPALRTDAGVAELGEQYGFKDIDGKQPRSVRAEFA